MTNGDDDEDLSGIEPLQPVGPVLWGPDQIAELRAEIAELRRRTERSSREVELAAEVCALKARVETERAEAHEAAEYAARAVALYTESYNEMLDERDRALRALESLQDDIEEHLPAYAADPDTDERCSASEAVEHAGDEIRELLARVAALKPWAWASLPGIEEDDGDRGGTLVAGDGDSSSYYWCDWLASSRRADNKAASK